MHTAAAAAAAKSRQLCPTLRDPTDSTHQAPPSLGFSRQEYWSGLPFPSLWDLPDPGIEPASPMSPASPALAGKFLLITGINNSVRYEAKKERNERLWEDREGNRIEPLLSLDQAFPHGAPRESQKS